MRVLSVIPHFSLASGGDVNVCRNVALALSERGHEVTILTWKGLSEPEMLDDLATRGVEYVVIDGRDSAPSHLFAPTLNKWLGSNIHLFDVVHLHTFRSAINNHVTSACRRNGIPYIIQAHGSVATFFQKPLLKHAYDMVWGRRMVAGASRLMALNEKEKEEYRSIYQPQTEPVIIANGVDVRPFQSTPSGLIKQRLGISPDIKLITYVGRIVNSKGIDMLLEAFSTLDREDTRLLIAGPDAGFESEMESLVEGGGTSDRVMRMGFISDQEKREVLKDSYLFITPKYTGFPITFLEACAAGVPIITSSEGDSLPWIDGQAGIVCEYDAGSIADAIDHLLDSPAERETLAANCLKVAEEFSWENIAKEVEGLYQSISSRP